MCLVIDDASVTRVCAKEIGADNFTEDTAEEFEVMDALSN